MLLLWDGYRMEGVAGLISIVFRFEVVPLINFHNMFFKRPSTIPSVSSSSSVGVTPTALGVGPVRMLLVNRTCSQAMKAVALGILGCFNIKCYSATNRPILFNKALSRSVPCNNLFKRSSF